MPCNYGIVTRQINFSGKLNLQQLVLSSSYYDQWSKHDSMLIEIVYFENDCPLVALTKYRIYLNEVRGH